MVSPPLCHGASKPATTLTFKILTCGRPSPNTTPTGASRALHCRWSRQGDSVVSRPLPSMLPLGMGLGDMGSGMCRSRSHRRSPRFHRSRILHTCCLQSEISVIGADFFVVDSDENQSDQS